MRGFAFNLGAESASQLATADKTKMDARQLAARNCAVRVSRIQCKVMLGLAVGSGLVACGARTGLYLPDAEVETPVDVGPMDVGVDADEPLPCIEVVPGTDTVTAAFTLPVALAVVDVMFLIDATASMQDEIDNVRTGLRSVVVPGVQAAIPDAAFGVALVGEFPVEPHGPAAVRPYDLRAPITREVLQVEGALESLPSWGNFDEPEAQVEGLYQVSTGDGLSPLINPLAGCPRGGEGGACFRSDALPLVLLITDAPMNNGPRDVSPRTQYSASSFAAQGYEAPHTYAQALEAVQALGALVIGLGARDAFSMSPMPHLRAIAADTGAIAGDGSPLAFDIGGTGRGVDSNVVRAVQRLAEGTPLDVDAIVEDVPGDGIDAAALVRRVRPLQAVPADGVASIGETQFVGVVPGTEVTFEVEIDASELEPMPETRRARARLIFRAFERSRLGRIDLEFLIPGTDGERCDP